MKTKLLFLITMFCSAQFALADTNDAVLTAQTDSINTLGWNIAAELLETDQNLIYSPLSTSAAMQMVVLGATNNNRKEMMNVMGLTDESVTLGFQKLGISLTDVPTLNEYKFDSSTNDYVATSEDAYEITLTNAVWLNEEMATLNTKYESDLAQFYQAPATAIPFTDLGVETINEWVSKNTQKKITKLISELDGGDGRLVLTNAIRIKAKWEKPFDFATEKPFTNSKNETLNVKTMIAGNEGQWIAMLDTAEITAISLPTKGADTKGNSRIQMHILMPKSQSANGLVKDEKMIESTLMALNAETPDATKVQMPEFKIETKDALNLIPPFKALGMQEAFILKPGNFDDMLAGDPEALKITSILQKAIIEVDINGFEAAAATAVGVGTESMPMPAQRSAVIDKAFVYVVRDEALGVNLFVGVVNDPSI